MSTYTLFQALLDVQSDLLALSLRGQYNDDAQFERRIRQLAKLSVKIGRRLHAEKHNRQVGVSKPGV